MPSNHPLPSAPGQPQQNQQQGRPRAKSSFSFRSTHSRKSSQGSGHKIDLIETHTEKEAHRLTTKADPTMAMQEAEPSAVASGVKSSLASIRDIQHRDAEGNPIADPDRSNPTRSRWERPLDTIRSFEAAIDGNYSRKSYMRSESVSDGASNFNRRSSYYGGTQVTTDDRPRYGHGGSYGGQRGGSFRPESQFTDNGRPNGNRPDSYYYNSANPDGAGPSNGYYPNRARYPRTASEPHFNASGVYPPNGNQQSYETVTTASGSGGSSGEPAGYTTDPSSENSSVDRMAAVPGREPAETYGIGFGSTPQYAPPGFGINQRYGSNSPERQGNVPNGGYHNQGPQSVPRTDFAAAKGPIKLGAGTEGSTTPSVYEAPKPVNEKRKSWFGKRLSKNK
ncbi:hypothetical protein PVAG01_09245 [Phlyctema vagabunda]|uniref:Uncharacterized protein n=1 Tax=Phlyctema vagabunda TaxID=108571 RepID=A0ABR4P6V3_9HELO